MLRRLKSSREADECGVASARAALLLVGYLYSLNPKRRRLQLLTRSARRQAQLLQACRPSLARPLRTPLRSRPLALDRRA